MARFMPPGNALAEHLHDGDEMAFEGFTHPIPDAITGEGTKKAGTRE